MTFTKIVAVYCSIAFILLLSLIAGLATSNILSRISNLEDKIVKLEFELNKREILSDTTSDDKFVVIIPERLTTEVEVADESDATETAPVESPVLDIQDDLK